MKELQKLLEEMASQIELFEATAVVDKDGIPLAGLSANPNLDVAVPSGMFANAKREVDKAFEITEWGEVTEFMFVSSTHIVTLDALPNGHYLGISVKSSANLGMVRAIKSKYIPKIKEILLRG